MDLEKFLLFFANLSPRPDENALSLARGPIILRQMTRYNLWTLVAVLNLAGSVADAGAPFTLIGPAPQPPAIGHEDRRFLSRAVRRTVEQYLADRSHYASPYMPTSLSGAECRFVVTLRHKGRQVGIGSAGPGPIVQTAIEATLAAVSAVEQNGVIDGDSVGTLLIEMEAAGAEQVIECSDDWLRSNAIDRVLEPGLDGLVLAFGVSAKRVSPGELTVKNLPPSGAVKHMMAGARHAPRNPTLSRFRSMHWYQAGHDGKVVTLRRGMTLVKPGDVSKASIEAAIDSLGAYLKYRQRPAGLFAYEYEPATESYSDVDNYVHQAGAAWALAEYAVRTDIETYRRAAELGIRVHAARVRELAGIDGASFVSSPDSRDSLGLTAYVLMTLNSPLLKNQYAEARDRLTAGILWLQNESGEFIAAFPPTRHPTMFKTYPGVVLAALFRQYVQKPSKPILEAFNIAVTYYTESFFQRPRLRLAAGLLKPIAEMAAYSNRKDLAEPAYRLADWLIEHQLTADNCQWAELHGGVRQDDSLIPDITTAICLNGWIEASRAARRFGDHQRAAIYDAAAERAVRFVLQLQVREAEMYYLRTDRDAVGGVRTSPADSRLSIYNVQVALMALMNYMDTYHKPEH